MSFPPRRSAWVLVALSVFTLFTFLGSRGLNEPDEGRYAEIGREMAVTGEWLVPHLNGFEHFQKPPLLYWATASCIRLLGANEWAARLPPALAALGTVLLLCWIGTTLFSREIGYLAGLILLSSSGFFIVARLLTPDMLMTFWITAALGCFVQFAYCGRGWRWAFLFFAAIGLGFLTKGPMALIVPLGAAGAWQIAARRALDAPRLPWLRGLLLTLAISLSWFVVLSFWRHELFDYFWRYELVERFASSNHGRAKPFWFFLPVIAIALVPWVFLLPRLAHTAWAKWRAGRPLLADWLLLGWTIPPFFILSISGSKLPTYILPLLPALALALARLLVRDGAVPVWAPRLALASLALFLTGAALVPALNDQFGAQASLRDLIRPLAAQSQGSPARVYAVGVRCQSLPFYLQRLVSATREQSDIVLSPTPEQAKRLLSAKDFEPRSLLPAAGEAPTLVVTRRRQAESSFLRQGWQELGKAGDFVLLQSPAPAPSPTWPRD